MDDETPNVVRAFKLAVEGGAKNDVWMQALAQIAKSNDRTMIRPLLLALPFESLLKTGHLHHMLHAIYTAESLPSYEAELVHILPQLVNEAPSLLLEAIPRVLNSDVATRRLITAISECDPFERDAARRAMAIVEEDTGDLYADEMAKVLDACDTR